MVFPASSARGSLLRKCCSLPPVVSARTRSACYASPEGSNGIKTAYLFHRQLYRLQRLCPALSLREHRHGGYGGSRELRASDPGTISLRQAGTRPAGNGRSGETAARKEAAGEV